jgi:peptidoglycan hydrolase-like amidase
MPLSYLVTFGVFGLFHPTALTARAAPGATIVINSAGTTQKLEGTQTAAFSLTTPPTTLSGGDIILSVPDKIERRYHGTIRITQEGGELVAIVEMDREVAVASIVAAEIAPGAPLEALKAQAVIARSFLAASHGRHRGFQFCDTTHCQFIRSWPSAASDAYRAAADTRGQLLAYQGVPFPALYSAACGGHTLAAAENGNGYDYRAVACEYCRRHPEEPVRGHRLGMCQQGASGMANAGADYHAILNHYYPGTAVINFSPR